MLFPQRTLAVRHSHWTHKSQTCYAGHALRDKYIRVGRRHSFTYSLFGFLDTLDLPLTRSSLSPFAMGLFNKRTPSNTASSTSSPTVVPELTKDQLKRATRTRKVFTLLTSLFLFITVLFLILVEIGGIYNKALVRNWYFIKLDLSHIIPTSVPNFALINTIAQTLGLHDFYSVGLWGFCEGYKGEGVTYCSHPKMLYWFNPVQILRNELLAGASSTCIYLHILNSTH
jgi:hypothetical protein